MVKICVVTCVSDNSKYNKMVASLEDNVPEGCWVHFHPIHDARSMGDGYNKALTASFGSDDIVVYVHQDVVFKGKEFLIKAIEMLNSGFGLVGAVGVEKLPDSLVFWEGRCFGKVTEDRGCGPSLLDFGYQNELPHQVDMVDGLIMVTNKFIDWPQMPGFHFYDMLMSQKFVRKGMKVGVPHHTGESLVHEIGTREFDSVSYLRDRDTARLILSGLN